MTAAQTTERIAEYLRSIYYGQGYVTLDKLINMDMKYDPDLRDCEVTAEQVISQALLNGFKVQMKYDEWCLAYGRNEVR